MIMKVYDTLLIGSGYASLGFALTRRNCVIIECQQSADTRFYLPLKSFKATNYSPKTKLGKELNQLYSEKGFYKNDMINLNGLECGFCEFISRFNVDIFFKSRVISINKIEELYEVSIIGVNGITTLKAKHVIDSTKAYSYDTSLTILYSSANPKKVAQDLITTFPKCSIEKAFFDNRYAVHIPANGDDYNLSKRNIFRVWKKAQIDAKIIYFSPVLSRHITEGNTLNDELYDNPIKAFDVGVEFASLPKGDK